MSGEIAMGWLSVVGPLCLELLGVLPRSYRFVGVGMEIVPFMMQFPEHLTLAFLGFMSLAVVTTAGVYGGALRDAVVDADLRLKLQAWQVRQVLPQRV